jgi:hypothetical protein
MPAGKDRVLEVDGVVKVEVVFEVDRAVEVKVEGFVEVSVDWVVEVSVDNIEKSK